MRDYYSILNFVIMSQISLPPEEEIQDSQSSTMFTKKRKFPTSLLIKNTVDDNVKFNHYIMSAFHPI